MGRRMGAVLCLDINACKGQFHIMDQEPLHRRIAGDIERRIASGEWRPGFRIPTEAELTGIWHAAGEGLGLEALCHDLGSHVEVCVHSDAAAAMRCLVESAKSRWRMFGYKTASAQKIFPCRKWLVLTTWQTS